MKNKKSNLASLWRHKIKQKFEQYNLKYLNFPARLQAKVVTIVTYNVNLN